MQAMPVTDVDGFIRKVTFRLGFMALLADGVETGNNPNLYERPLKDLARKFGLEPYTLWRIYEKAVAGSTISP